MLWAVNPPGTEFFIEELIFPRIKTSIPIPNLIEVQKNSYERFCRWTLLPNERDDIGLQTFHFRLPDFRFPRRQPARVRRLFDRQLGVQVRQPEGPASPSHHLPQSRLRRDHQTDPFHPGDMLCHIAEPSTRTSSPSVTVRRPGRPAAEVRSGRVRRARHDLCGAAQGHHPAHRLRQRPETGAEERPRHQRNRKCSSAKFR
jgi:hypothetical protein